MNRSLVAVAIAGCGVAFGCNADKPPAVVNPAAGSSPIATAPSASASTASTSSTSPVANDAGTGISAGAADAMKRLSSPTQEVRDGAAAELRKLVATGPAAAGDPGEAIWKAKLAAIPLAGMSLQDLEAATGGGGGGKVGDMGGSSTTFRLDHYWTTVVRFDRSGKLLEVGPLTRSARAVWVAQPPDYAGKWVTYFVNGAVARDIQFARGAYERFTAYFDNGQLAYEQHYENGKIEGPEVGFHRDGTKAYEGAHRNGRPSGPWVHWYANGALQSERTYVNGELDGPWWNWREDGTKSSRIDYRAGKETGQAAWDEQGKLIYARGSAENAKTEK